MFLKKDKKTQLKNDTWTVVKAAAKIKGCSVESLITLVTGHVCTKANPRKIHSKVRVYALRVVQEKYGASEPMRTKLVYRRSRRGFPYMGRVSVRA